MLRILPERDVAALLAVVGELAGLDAPVAFPPEFVRTLGELVGSDEAAYSVLDRRNEHVVFGSWWADGDGGIEVESPGDFGERERLMLDLLEPHLERRAENVRLATEAAAALADVEQHVAGEAHDVVLVSASGAIEFASPHSRELLGRHFGHHNGRLPDDLAAAVSTEQTIVTRTGDSRLTVRATRTGGLLVLLLSEGSMRVDRLTPRQREILAQVGAGLTDIQIADRLEISPATVRKHLEQIYERLDVHTRTAAAAALR